LGAVRPERELTAYARLGDAFALGCALVVVAVLFRRATAVRLRVEGGSCGAS
jgi:apolipoprotein N-acyltransferase